MQTPPTLDSPITILMCTPLLLLSTKCLGSTQPSFVGH